MIAEESQVTYFSHKPMHYTESIFFFQGLRTCVLPLPVCPYAKQVAIPRSNIHSTSGFAVYLEENTEHCCLKKVFSS